MPDTTLTPRESHRSSISRLAACLGVLLVVLAALSAAVAPAAAAPGEQSADLTVRHPSWMDAEMGTAQTNDSTVYVVQHDRVRIQPQNFDAENVVGFGVETTSGELTYDDGLGLFVFESAGETGTFKLYWEVETQRVVTQNNSTTTQTVRERYTAVVRVEQAQSYRHVSDSEYEQTEDDAANWSSFASSVREIAGDDANMEQQTQKAVNLLRLSADPFAALTGSYTTTWLLLVGFGGVGSILVTFTIAAWHIWTRRHDIKYRFREETVKAEAKDLDDRLAEYTRTERQNALQNMDWQDIIEDDHVARAMRDTLGETVFDGAVRLQELLLPEKLVRDRLAAMGENGYVGLVVYEPVATDGGGDAPTGVDGDDRRLVSADLAHKDELGDEGPENGEVVDLAAPPEAFVDALDWTHPDLVSFDLVGASSPVDSQVTVDELDLDALVDELDAQRQAFDDPDLYGQYLLQFVEDVRESDYCDEQGYPDSTRYVLNNWLQICQTTTQKFEVPLLEYLGDGVERALIMHDPLAEADDAVRDIQRGVDA